MTNLLIQQLNNPLTIDLCKDYNAKTQTHDASAIQHEGGNTRQCFLLFNCIYLFINPPKCFTLDKRRGSTVKLCSRLKNEVYL